MSLIGVKIFFLIFLHIHMHYPYGYHQKCGTGSLEVSQLPSRQKKDDYPSHPLEIPTISHLIFPIVTFGDLITWRAMGFNNIS